MHPDDGKAANWREAASYDPLFEADRSIFAWEWLRRDPAYRDAAARGLIGFGPAAVAGPLAPEHWGLHAFENPDAAAPAARPLWRADVHGAVLPALAAGSASASDAFDLLRFNALSTIQRDPEGREHLLLSDGLRAIRLDVLAGTVAAGPVELRYLLAGFASAEKPLLALRRLIALRRAGRFSRTLHPSEARARRWILTLRAHDALEAGAGQREIAAVLLSREAGERRWRSHAPSLRSQVQRLVRGARMMRRGGYRALLR